MLGRTSVAYDYSDSWGLVMISPICRNCHSLNPGLQMTRDGIVFNRLAGYPNSESKSAPGCLVVVDDENIFTAGGDNGVRGG